MAKAHGARLFMHTDFSILVVFDNLNRQHWIPSNIQVSYLAILLSVANGFSPLISFSVFSFFLNVFCASSGVK